MPRRSRNEGLRALLAEADWTSGELARAVNALGEAQAMRLQYDRTSVAHWLTGSKPRSNVADLVAAAFSRRIGRLVTVEETGLTKHSGQPQPNLRDSLNQDDPLRRLIVLAGADASPAGRSSLTQSGYRLTASPIPNWYHRPSSKAVPDPRHRATAEDVETIQTVVSLVADQTEQFGGRHGRSAVAAYLADDVSRILAGNATATLRQDLLTSTAQLTYMLARMTVDAGYHGLAQTYHHTALDIAREAENPVTYAVVLRAMSVHALQMGHPRRALELAEAAAAALGINDRGPWTAFVLSQLAVTHAGDGQRRSAIAELMTAETLLERVGNVPGPFTVYPRAGLEYQRARVFLALGTRSKALESLRDSARHREPHDRRSSALTEYQLGKVLLSIGYLDEACTRWERFISQSRYVRSACIDQALIQLHKTLKPYKKQRNVTDIWAHLQELIWHKGALLPYVWVSLWRVGVLAVLGGRLRG